MKFNSVPDDKEIRSAAALLRSGGTVAFPTETVYGLGADASNPFAVQKIFAIKGRPSFHPLIVHVAAGSELARWAKNIPDAAWQLAEAFWPGPLTLILQRSALVPDAVTGGQNTVGLRAPDHPVAAALLHEFGGGIAAPSANRFGQLSPTTAQHVHKKLGGQVGMILDGGACHIGVESTIVSFVQETPTLLRPGGLAVEAIEEVLGQKILLVQSGAQKVRASGMLDSHYAPGIPFEACSGNELVHRARQLVSMGYRVAVLNIGNEDAENLGLDGITCFCMPDSSAEYARELYATLHGLDCGIFNWILAEAPPATQEWNAINDRMRRASCRAVPHSSETLIETCSSGETLSR